MPICFMKKFKAGKYINQGHYKSFQPEFINRTWRMEDMELLTLLSKADRHLGRLDMYSEYVPSVDLFISMHVIKEATQSSKIEGTQTNIKEALLEQEDLTTEKRDDWVEVQNYIKAMHKAVELLKKLPFSSRLIKETHKVLMQGVRGENKMPGEFRTSQNWIGGASINNAAFVPPVHTSIPALIADLEKFAHARAHFFPDLLRIALMHYQLETIHPFLDGNGRVGRLIITLYFVENEILKVPILYLSDYFERNRNLYYENLMLAREKQDLLMWFKFFVEGVIETAKSGIATFDNILKLRERIDEKIQTLGSRSIQGKKLINALYKRPLVDASKVAEIIDASAPTAYKLLDDFQKLGILTEFTGGKRSKRFTFDEYIDLFA